MRDLKNGIKKEQALAAVTATSTTTSAAIDLQGFNSLSVLFDIGASGDTLASGLYWTLSLTECDTVDGTYTDVADADVLEGINSIVINDPAEDAVLQELNYVGGKRFVKAVATATGTHTNGTPMGITALKGHASDQPVA